MPAINTPEIKEIESIELWGLSSLTAMTDPGYSNVWRQFGPIYAQSDQFEKQRYNIHIYSFAMEAFRPDSEFTKWAAAPLKAGGKAPENWGKIIIPGGTYAVFTYEGKTQEFAATWMWFFREWLPASGYKERTGPHFEIIHQGSGPDEIFLEDVWVPVLRF